MQMTKEIQIVKDSNKVVETAPRTVDRRGFMKDLVVGGAAALAAGTFLAGPRRANACPDDGTLGADVSTDVTLGSPVSIGEIKSLKVTCLSEVGWWDTPKFLADINAAGGMSTSQWAIPFDPKNAGGYSALIEAEDLDGKVHTMLLDTGWDVSYMSWVFKREGVAQKLENRVVERAILSHEHLDHLWGLPALCAINRYIPLVVPSTLTNDAWGFIWKSRYAGPLTSVKPGCVHKHFPGFASTVLDIPIILGVRGEQILFFNVKGKGLVIVTGCCHCGIKSAIDFARTNIATETGRFHGLFGGMHISALEVWSPTADQMLDSIQQAQFDVIGSNHCTGIIAVEKMLERGLPVAMGSANFGSKSSRYIGNGDSLSF
jgi:7,8-dihydropterin-6-yl-methyl-4-(beta-D-ribofuranosyl)aminobenzene 5'-phosphate synthase